MARKKITVSEESDAMLRDLMESRELDLGAAADLAVRVGYNRLAALDRHKIAKKEAAKSTKKTKKKAKKKTAKKAKKKAAKKKAAKKSE